MWFACPRGGRQQEERRTTKATPDLVCNDCGVQMVDRDADGGRAIPRQR